MKFLKSKFFIVLAIIAAVLVLVPALLAAFGQVDIVRSGLKTIAKPFEWCAAKAADAVDGFVGVFTEYDELKKENEALKEKLEELENNASQSEALKSENEWLKKYLELYSANPEFIMTDASVISHEAGNYATVLTLNRGRIHGIKRNSPVIASDGVLGYVSEVGLDWCKVSSIIETSNAVGVYADRTGVLGTVEGSLELRKSGRCLMRYASNADIKVGDVIYTSGNGSTYPADLLVGRVVAIEADEATRQLLAVIEPAVDFNSLDDLHRVMVICGYDTGD